MLAISLPFRFDSYGRVAVTQDPRKVWADRVRSVLTTYVGERVMRPEWGSDLPANIFAAIEDEPSLVAVDVEAAFTEYLPFAELEDVVLVEEDEENGEVTLEVIYRIPRISPDPLSTSISITNTGE
jgi:phage baseplate assembly protein W